MLFLISLIFLHGQMCPTGGYPYFLNRAADYLIRMADGALPREPFMQIGKFLGLKLAWQADNLFFRQLFLGPLSQSMLGSSIRALQLDAASGYLSRAETSPL